MTKIYGSLETIHHNMDSSGVLANHTCDRCGVSNILVEFNDEHKQKLCPWCTHWLGLPESMREVIMDPKPRLSSKGVGS